jgi:hypothetical protein
MHCVASFTSNQNLFSVKCSIIKVDSIPDQLLRIYSINLEVIFQFGASLFLECL